MNWESSSGRMISARELWVSGSLDVRVVQLDHVAVGKVILVIAKRFS